MISKRICRWLLRKLYLFCNTSEMIQTGSVRRAVDRLARYAGDREPASALPRNRRRQTERGRRMIGVPPSLGTAQREKIRLRHQ